MKSIIDTLLNKISGLSRTRKAFLVHIFTLFISIRGRLNFMNMSRFGDYSEKSYRLQFEKPLTERRHAMTEHILNRIFLVPFGRTNASEVIQKPAVEVDGNEMDIDDMRTEFPNLVRSGEFVQAMEIVHGHGRFSWFYVMFDKISRGFFGKH